MGKPIWKTGYKQMQVRLTATMDEYKELVKAADREGETVSNYLRIKAGLAPLKRGRRLKGEAKDGIQNKRG